MRRTFWRCSTSILQLTPASKSSAWTPGRTAVQVYIRHMRGLMSYKRSVTSAPNISRITRECHGRESRRPGSI